MNDKKGGGGRASTCTSMGENRSQHAEKKKVCGKNLMVRKRE
jgi:hypothetical protein